jgi:DNA-directed RNA polymerase beta subunit
MADKLPGGLRGVTDYPTERQRIFDGVVRGLSKRYPLENDLFKLELADLEYTGPQDYTLSDQKNAILRRRSLTRGLRGTWNLIDKKTGQPVDSKRAMVARVPYLTQRGTYIVNGNEYTVANQARLKSGVFTRVKDNGDYEAHFNVLRGGPSFRIFMEPTTGVFRLRVGQSNMNLYPVLRAMGLDDHQLKQTWGGNLLAANVAASERKGDTTLKKAWERLASARAKKETNDPTDRDFRTVLDKFELDPIVTSRTLGQGFNRVSPEALTRTTQKLINISKGEEDTDDRDSLEFQDTYSAEDLFGERVSKDAGQLGRRMLWKATLRRNLSGLPSGALNPQIEAVFHKSGLSQPLEEVNLLDPLDQNRRITRMGEGGIPSYDAVPQEARNVQPSHMGFIDPVRTPESKSAGVDFRMAYHTYKGDDKQLYARVRNIKSGKTEFQSPQALAGAIVAFPGELAEAQREGFRKVKAMVGSQIKYVDKRKVDYEIPSGADMFDMGSNLVPMVEGIKGGRLLMGGKMLTQAMPLQEPEAPLVQSADDDGVSFEHKAGEYAGVVRATEPGTVTAVGRKGIRVRGADGKTRVYDMYNNFPLNRKSYLSNTPQVKAGDTVRKGQLLARSNMTDQEGNVALGKNLRVAYMPYKGLNFEDAIVISESAANKLASEMMYTEKMDKDNMTSLGTGKFRSIFPSVFNRAQLEKLDDTGVARPGQVLEEGDPVVLAVQRRAPKGASMLYRGGKRPFRDASITWKHPTKGMVTDVWSDDKGVKVAVKTFAPMEVGDKMSGRYGDKGVVGAVVPDDKMPMGQGGKPLEVILNPLTVISRTNPSQLVEAVLGKIAAKTGKPYKMPPFSGQDLVDYAVKEMEAAGLNDTETVTDPELGRKISDVLIGNRFFMKLHHTAEAKTSGRSLGAYTAEGVPAQTPGESDKPKRVGFGELQALVAHGAIENIKDMKNIKGQRNDDYWRAMTLGYTPPSPRVPAVYKKFLADLQAAGINVKKQGDKMHLLAMTDRDVDKMSAGEIKSPDTVRWLSEFGRGTYGEKSMDPVEGGLFDRGITGGHGGNRWSHIRLREPMPQPVMEEPIRTLLGLTKKDFEDVVAGRKNIATGTGTRAIHEALKRTNLDREIESSMEAVRSPSSAAARDLAIKRLKYLDGLQRSGVAPSDLMVTKVPVLPPVFRPITATADFTMMSGSNRLYMDLIQARDNLEKVESVLEGEPVQQARLDLYKAFRAVTGLGDPVSIKTVNHRSRGLLSEVFGGSPKFGSYQRKLLGMPVDMAARAAISPNPDLDMDQVGIPEDKAWQLYAPFVVRRLVKGMSRAPDARAKAVRMVAEHAPKAREILQDEMEHRPVLATRAPALHKFSLMAFRPVLTNSRTLQLSPQIVTGFNADFDGDAMNFHVVVGDKAIREAKEKMLPSRNLRSPSDFATLWLPRQEFQQGLYRASTKRSGRRMLPRYDSIEDIIAAFKRGELNIEDVVSVKD